MNNQLDLIVELLTDIRDRLTSIEIANEAVIELERLREKNRKNVSKFRAKRNAHVSLQKCVSLPKEGESREGGKENLSPTPPIREKGEETKGEEKSPPLHSTARAREENSAEGDESKPATPIVDVHTPPRLKDLLAWAHSRHFTDDKFTREWFDKMTNVYYWLDPKTGEPFKHWPSFYLGCLKSYQIDERREAAAKKREENNRSRIGTVKHGANWRGTRKEDLQDVL